MYYCKPNIIVCIRLNGKLGDMIDFFMDNCIQCVQLLR